MYELEVEGMACGGCVNRVKKAVQAVDSVQRLMWIYRTKSPSQYQRISGCDPIGDCGCRQPSGRK